jgi:tRNA modification GTPase
MREGLQKIVSSDETIVAVATPPGRSSIGVIRISGANTATIAQRFFRPNTKDAGLEHRMAIVGKWCDSSNNPIDEVVVTYFRAPQSYTGEDVLEISAHGSPLILRRIIESVLSAGSRTAQPGEFTLRAVAHGKMDLVQAEAVRDFIDAQTERQAKTALSQMEGALSKRVQPIKQQLVDVIARLEAGIDFAEDDVDVPSNESVAKFLEPVLSALETIEKTFNSGNILQKGLQLAILGKPNVGKSSLFNRLVSQDRAIVTDIPGTTRDVLTETIHLDGVPLRFADTAGVRQARDRVESLGVIRTFETLAEADFALIVLDGSSLLEDDDRHVLEKTAPQRHLVVINKSDLPQVLDTAVLNGASKVFVSAKTGQGIEDLRDTLRAFLVERGPHLADDVILTNARQHEAVSSACHALQAAQVALAGQVPHEMVLLDLYGALAALNELTGEVVTEDILDRIFSTFCIGK